MPRALPGPLAALALVGCYLAHERPFPGRDVGPPPADVRPDTGPPRVCAFVPEDQRFVTDTPFAAHSPRIGWDGEALGVAFFESDGSLDHPVVSWTRVSTELSTVTPLTRVGEESHSWAEAAWDPRVGYAICWNGDPGGATATRFRLRDRAGAELAPRLDLDELGGPCEGMARATGSWGMVWRHGRESTSMRVGVVDDRGALLGPPIDLDEPIAGSGRGGLIAADRDGFIAAVALTGEGIALTRIGGDGSLGARAMVPAPRARYGAIAVHDDGTIGLAIRDGERERGGLRFVRLTPSLEVLPGEQLLVVEGRGVRHPRVLPIPGGWAVLWVEQGESSMPATAAVLAHLDQLGRPIEPRRIIVDGQNSDYGGPGLVFHEGRLYVALGEPVPPGTGHEQVNVHRLSCVTPAPSPCAPQDARSDGTRCDLIPGYAWDGRTCNAIFCGCAGSACDRIAPLEAECVADHLVCMR